MSEFWGHMIYFALGLVAGAVFAIQFTKHRWWSHGALEHCKWLQDEVYRYESQARRGYPISQAHQLVEK